MLNTSFAPVNYPIVLPTSLKYTGYIDTCRPLYWLIDNGDQEALMSYLNVALS